MALAVWSCRRCGVGRIGAGYWGIGFNHKVSIGELRRLPIEANARESYGPATLCCKSCPGRGSLMSYADAGSMIHGLGPRRRFLAGIIALALALTVSQPAFAESRISTIGMSQDGLPLVLSDSTCTEPSVSTTSRTAQLCANPTAGHSLNGSTGSAAAPAAVSGTETRASAATVAAMTARR